MVVGSNQVIERSNLTSKLDNSDYDGDSLAVFGLHSNQAKADFKYAYVKNMTEFEHMDQLLIDYEHEAIYSAYMLTLKASENINWSTEINELKDIVFTIQDFKENPGRTISVRDFNKDMTVVEAAINRSLLGPIKAELIELDEYHPIYLIEEDGLLTKKNLTKFTMKYWQLVNKLNAFYKREVINFWDGIHELDKFFLELGSVLSYGTPSFDMRDFAVGSPEIQDFKSNLLSVEPFLAFHQNMILFEKIASEISKEDNILNHVFNSGARLKSVQLLKAASNTGIPTDIYGKAFAENIKSSLLDGLNQKEYFMTGDSARLALAQRQEAIPKGGELQRKFFFTIGVLKLDRDEEDCHTKKYFKILVRNNDHLLLLNHRWYLNPSSGLEEVIDINDKSLIGQEIDLRSPITCAHKDYRICKKCMGTKLPSSVNLGSIVGAALSEGIIQSVLRAHHFGGAFIATENPQILDIMRRSSFLGNDTIVSTSEDINTIKEYLMQIYDEGEIEFTETVNLDTIELKIKVLELPFNDDSVKILNGIVSLIDRNRDAAALILPKDLYNELVIVIEQNSILSVYLELILSLLYYDEDGVLYRYSDKEPHSQVALKNIVELLDPKLSIFYNFSNRIISKIYNKKVEEEVPHMYMDLVGIYE